MSMRLIGMSLAVVLTAAALAPLVDTMHAQSPNRTVRHVVVFKYTPEATPAQIQQITDAFRALKSTIPGIVGFEDGINDSPEGKNQGFTHVYVMTFENAAARDAYLPHPEHQKFGKLLRSSGIFVDAFVVDYSPTVTHP